MSDKELLVRGWSDTELRQILGDFQRLSGNRLSSSFSTEIHTNDSAVWQSCPQQLDFNFANETQTVTPRHFPVGLH